jgi:two-component system response regulator FlrC
MARILVADDEPGIREFLSDALELDGHDVVTAEDGTAAAALVDREGFDLVITDLKMPGMDGMDLLRKIRSEQPETEVIMLTAHGTVNNAVEAMKLGAFDYLNKPISGPEELCVLASRALERRQLLARQAGAERTAPATRNIQLSWGDPAMDPVVAAIEKVARTPATVLLLGESGTGKELAANHIHQLSDRRDGPFMAVNCAALTATLLESELFGHEKGAFTGANERHRGRIELADGGTFFLDEVGELKPELQAKLLRVLQERRFERVGGTRTLEVDVRWVAATNRDLRAMISEGTFREDLYHRLAVFPIRIPPLRERPNDILPIARSLLGPICQRLHRPTLRVGPDAETRLIAWSWPGNVRELANVLERAAILAEGDTISADHLWLEAAAAPTQEVATQEVKPLVEMERDAIIRALSRVDGNRRRAAELLGIGERTLYTKIKKLAIEE